MDALMKQHLKQRVNQNTNDSSSFFLSSDELGRANDFISSLTDTELSSLNSANAATSVLKPTPQESSSSQEAADPYSQLFPLVSATEGSSSSSSSVSAPLSASEQAANDPLNLLPTPIGVNCQVVSTKDQVPLNQSLISQSNSLAEMFTIKQKMMMNSASSSLDLLFPNLTASLNASTARLPASNNYGVVEADFGATSAASPLIVAAAAAASPTASNALAMNFSAPAALSNTKLAAVLEQSQHDDGTYQHQHRSQQSTRWNERYQELIQYKQEHGDCSVPYLWERNRPLSEWVKRQRHQYKLKKESKHSALTDEREALLSNLGFVWNSRASLWDGRFQELVQYYRDYGNLKVSKRTPRHRALSVWLKRQRHACRLFLSGDKTTCMTEERMQKLLDLGVKIHKKT